MPSFIETAAKAVFASLITLSLPGSAALAQINADPDPTQRLQPGYTVLTAGHTDIGVGYGEETPGAGAAFHLHAHTDFNEYEANQVLFSVPNGAGTAASPSAFVTLSNSDGRYNFISSGSSVSFFRLPQNAPSASNPLLFLGLGAESPEINPSDFAPGSTIRLSLVSVVHNGVALSSSGNPTGPNFALYFFDGNGDLQTPWATKDGITAADGVNLTLGAHEHFNWAFTNTGIYEVKLRATGTLANNTNVEDTRTYYFGVGTTTVPTNVGAAAAPEPASLALVGIGALGMMGAIRRRRRIA